MRLVVNQCMSLDGSIEFLGDWFDPGEERADPALDAFMQEQASEEEMLLLGRQTFQDFRSYWPEQASKGSDIGKHLDQVDKRVVSSTMTDPEWQNTTLIDGDPLDEVRRLREQPGGILGVTGSITLTHALIEAELVDEFRIFTYPAVQGRGRPLFPAGYDTASLSLTDHRSFDVLGIAYSSYQVSS